MEGLEAAALFLVASGCDLDRANDNGETPLHLAATHGLSELAREILKAGADPNVQTVMNDDAEVYRQTALHLAIARRHVGVVQAIIGRLREASSVDLNLKNSRDQTPLGLALSNNLHDIAMELLKGSQINFLLPE
jgi:ankyrin repeat protein